MISPGEEEYILDRACVPEHIPRLMTGISGAEAFLQKPFVFFHKDDWIIFVGYPLGEEFSEARLLSELQEAVRTLKPRRTWIIAPRIPDDLLDGAQDREKDEYYRLELASFRLNNAQQRAVRKASREASIEKCRRFSPEHAELTAEFLRRDPPPPRIRELFLRMADYVPRSPTSLVLEVRDPDHRLCAFFVLEMGAKNFATYVVGCYSRKHYVPHSSDFLCHEMILLAKESQKEYIHLGLGVNEGIRRFKKKWGGIPFLSYESCELPLRPKGFFSWLQAFGERP